jgi:hypothetical protein
VDEGLEVEVSIYSLVLIIKELNKRIMLMHQFKPAYK